MDKKELFMFATLAEECGELAQQAGKCNSRKGSKIITITPVTHQENKHQSVEPDETFLPNT